MKFLFLLVLLIFEWYIFEGVKIYLNGVGTSKMMQQVVYFIITLGFWISVIVFTFLDYSKLPRVLLNVMLGVIIIVLFSKLLIGVFFLLDDFRRIISFVLAKTNISSGHDPSRSLFLARLAMVAGGVPFFLLSYGALRNPYRYKVFRSKVNLGKLPGALRGLKIVQISDIHAGSLTRVSPVQKAVDLINDMDADLVFFTGDLVNNKALELDPYQKIFSAVRAKYGVFSVLGNHDYGDYVSWENAEEKARNLDNLKARHAEMGWRLLLNENENITVRGEEISIIGVENFSALARFHKYGDLSSASEGSKGSVQLLLSHDPSHWDFEITRNFKNIDITFSGHTHGFQFGIEIPGFIKWSPSQYIYKQWAGLYNKGEQYLYVNRGFGFLAYPGRVGILPEITLVELDNRV